VLRIRIVAAENFDEENSEFIPVETVDLELEHSLVSVSKWESKWEIPFLSTDNKTQEQVLDYIRMMNLKGDFPRTLFKHFSETDFQKIDDYINAKMTATTLANIKSTPSSEKVTSEIIYYWMIALAIPFECQYWHLARLLTLVQVCNRKNAPKEKLSKGQLAARNRDLNAQRRREMNSKG
jgi:hypothetical protein